MRYGMLLGAAPLAFATMLGTLDASADVGKEKASGSGKGIVGGALLGGELVCGVEALAGVKSPWAYLGGAVGGAAAGGVGGYFVEQATEPNARIPLLMLAGGMTLLIPTIAVSINATMYQPPADYLEDKPPADEPVANPPAPDNGAPPTTASPPTPAPAANPPVAPPSTTPAPSTTTPETPPAPPPAAPAPTSSRNAKKHRVVAHRALPPLALMPPALVGLAPGALALGVPGVELQDTYTRAEVAMYGVTQTTEVHIPVLNVVF